MTIYKNRYQATKAKRPGEVAVKVCGGYTIMTRRDWIIWRNQR